MHRQRPERIPARAPDLDPHTRQVRSVHGHPRDLLAGQVLDDRDRHERPLALHVLEDPPDIPFRHVDDRAQRPQRRGDVVGLLAQAQGIPAEADPAQDNS
jgi:hypothetical protein